MVELQRGFAWIFEIARQNILVGNLVIFFGKFVPYVFVLGVLWWINDKKSWRGKLYFFGYIGLAALIARGIITEAIRHFYPTLRPFSALGFEPLFSAMGSSSFPSGHASFFFALAVAIWLYDRFWGITSFGLALLIGVSRIFAGVHWPLDILSGALIGTLGAALAYWISKSFLPMNPKIEETPSEEKLISQA